NRTAVLQTDDDGGDEQQRRGQQQAGQREAHVAESLESFEDGLAGDLKALLEKPGLVEPVEGDLAPVNLMKQLQRVGRQAVEIEPNQMLIDLLGRLDARFAQDDGLRVEPAVVDVL